MIRGLHGLFYSRAPEAARAFLRDKLQLPFHDVGQGWLIFDLPEADLGVHPVDTEDASAAGTHDVSFYCDDIHGTVAELRARGVDFRHAPEDHGYGWVTYFQIPGGIEVQLYEPKYVKRAGKPAAKAKAKAKAKTKTKAKAKAKASTTKAKAKAKAKAPKKR
jgi:hypothetical protein